MDVKEILEKYLKENNYDGFISDECSCGLYHFMSCYCECDIRCCIPAYRCKCINCKNEFFSTNKNEFNCNDCD